MTAPRILPLAVACSACFGPPTHGIDDAVVAERKAELEAAGAVVQIWTNDAQPPVEIADAESPAFGARLTASAETLLKGAPKLLAWLAPREVIALRTLAAVTDVGPFVEAHVENPLTRQDAVLANPAWLTLPVRTGAGFGQLAPPQRADATVTRILPGGIDTLTPAAITADAVTAAIDASGVFAPTLGDDAPQTVSQARGLLGTDCRIPLISAVTEATAVAVVALAREPAAIWIDGGASAPADGMIDTRIRLERDDDSFIETIRESDDRNRLRHTITLSNDANGRPQTAQIRNDRGANTALLTWQEGDAPREVLRFADFDLNGTAETTTTTWLDAADAVTALTDTTRQIHVFRNPAGWPERVTETDNDGWTGCMQLTFTDEGAAATAVVWRDAVDCSAPSADAFAVSATGCPAEAFDLVWIEAFGAASLGPGLIRPDRRDPGLTD